MISQKEARNMSETKKSAANVVSDLLLGGSILAVVVAGAYYLNEDNRQTHPTAEELAEQTDKAVAEFPAEADGLEGPRQYCIEIGGRVLTIGAERNTVPCEVDQKTFVLPVGDENRNNDPPLYAACAATGGHVEGVAVAQDDPFNIPACVVG